MTIPFSMSGTVVVSITATVPGNRLDYRIFEYPRRSLPEAQSTQLFVFSLVSRCFLL